MALVPSLLQELDQEMAGTRKTLERVPEDRLDWRPHPKSFTLGALATHLANVPSWMAPTLRQDSMDIAPVGQPPFKAELQTSRAGLLAAFDRNLEAGREALAAATDESLLAPWTLLAGGKAIFTMPRAACLRSFILNHNVHHRAQLGVYLRMLDVPVPGLYGPSADEA